MRLNEHTIHSRGHRRTREHGRQSPIPATGRPLTTRTLHRMSGIKNHPKSLFANPEKRPHIRYQIIVSKSGASLGEKESGVSTLGDFFRDLRHIPGR